MSKTGRPTKYKPEYCEKLIEFFDVEPYADKELEHLDKDGNVRWIDYKRMANKLPTLRSFAKSIGVNIDTVYEWIKQHEEFSDAFTHAKDLQKWFLIENGLNGCYNPMFAIFTAKNITDMRDKSEVDNNTNLTVTGLEKLTDDQLDGLVAKLKNSIGETFNRESQTNSTESA